MTNLTRWKFACALFAALAGYGAVSAHRAHDHNAPAQTVVTPQGGGVPFALRRPIHVTPEAAGISEHELIDRIQNARSVHDVQVLAEKLGAVGDDDAVDNLQSLLTDNRRGVPEAILAMFGTIGTAHAINVVIAATGDERPDVRRSAISALGGTQSAKAEKVLLDIAARPADPAQTTAIAGLGAMGTDAAVAKLIELTSGGDLASSNAAVYALGSAQSPAAFAALRQLIDSPDSRLAAAALASVDVVDQALLDRLSNIVRSGDPELVAAAARDPREGR